MCYHVLLSWAKDFMCSFSISQSLGIVSPWFLHGKTGLEFLGCPRLGCHQRVVQTVPNRPLARLHAKEDSRPAVAQAPSARHLGLPRKVSIR